MPLQSLSLAKAFGPLRFPRGCRSFYGQQRWERFLLWPISLRGMSLVNCTSNVKDTMGYAGDCSFFVI